MFDNYVQAAPWFGIILGGVAGCLAVGLLAMSRGGPFSAIGGNPRKHLWSVIYAIPVPFLLQLAGSIWPGLLLAFIWLVAAPTVGLQTVFKPPVKLRMAEVLVGHAVFAVVVLVVFVMVVAIIA